MSEEQASKSWERSSVFEFSADADGFREFFLRLKRSGAVPEVTSCALEATGGYYSQPIFQALTRAGYTTLWLKNQAVHDLRETVYGRRSKTDAQDSRLIARLLYLRDAVGQEYAFHMASPGEAEYRNLRLLVELRWKQVQARRRASNQLTQVLDVLLPEMRLVFKKRTTLPTPLLLLERYPSVTDIAAASEEELHRLLVDEARSLHHQTYGPILKDLAMRTAGATEGVVPLQLAQDWLFVPSEGWTTRLPILSAGSRRQSRICPKHLPWQPFHTCRLQESRRSSPGWALR